ncbi:hypothetical protein [Sorangium sp. So ce1335]|uniref:hypothetical protein n=1 Tax=Sorangium sp. So ce1335 TaxID=3133335 RepID=UPI003F5DD037
MMRHSRIAVAVYLATTLLSVASVAGSVAGCGSDPVDPAGGTNVDPGQPPPPGPVQPGDGEDVAFGIDRLFLGETDRDGKKMAGSWKQYGFNLDGKVSSTVSQDLCKPVDGAPPSDVYPDGVDGIDNAFGSRLVGLIATLLSDPSTRVTEAIGNGDFTVIFKLEGLGDKASYNPLTAKLYGGATLGTAPSWNGSDKWPVVPELLEDAQDIESAKVVFPASYVVDNTWVSGPESQASFKLNLTFSGTTIGLTIRNVRIAMDLAPDHKSVVKGTLAGVLETSVLVEELRSVIGAVQPGVCEGPGLDTILDQVRRASDIMKDGSQDPSRECDAISIGLGFTAKQVQLGEVAPPAEATGVPCGEAPEGEGGGGGAGDGGAGGAGDGGAGDGGAGDGGAGDGGAGDGGAGDGGAGDGGAGGAGDG